MEFEKLITQRYSVRKFRPEHLAQPDVDAILAAGHKAPTGCNYQSQRILVLNTENAIVQKLQADRESDTAKTVAKQLYLLAVLNQRPFTAEELKEFLDGNYEILGKIQ